MVRFLLLIWFLTSGLRADEALWIRYPAVSPDGKHVVFSYGGNLFSTSIDGGTATPLTTHPGHEFMPVFSRDGKWLAFASDRHGNFDVFLMPATGGAAERLTFHSAHDYPSGFSSDNETVLFSSQRLDAHANSQFPSRVLPELYAASRHGGLPKQILTTPAQDAVFDPTGRYIAYHDRKGYENEWRKHHVSSVARDVWIHDTENGSHRKLTEYRGEDRNPRWSADGKTLFYLSEKSGSFNVWTIPVEGGEPRQLTFHSPHPVRFLSIDNDGQLCYSYHGQIHRFQPGSGAGEGDAKPIALKVEAPIALPPATKLLKTSKDATEMALSPDGKEMAVVVRGNIFVTSVEHGITKQITATPEQERSVSFAADGRTLLYASERSGSWDIYQARIRRDGEPWFFRATVIDESIVLENEHENFQPRYSPDGKHIAYLENRSTIKILELESKEAHVVVPGERNYSYRDGDQWFDWSPDGKWLLTDVLDRSRWMPEVALVSVDGGEIRNLTQSGYQDYNAQWAVKGSAMIWRTDRYGMRSHGSWGAEEDVFIGFFSQEAYDKFLLGKADIALMKKADEKKPEAEEKKKVEEADENPRRKKRREKRRKRKKQDEKPEDEKEKSDDPEKNVEPLKLDWEGLRHRTQRLTLHSSDLADAVLTGDGESLLYLAKFEKGHDLWHYKPRTKEAKLLAKLGAKGGDLIIDAEDKHVFVLADGGVTRVEIGSGKQKRIVHQAAMELSLQEERAYLFEHVWRQTGEKFYVENMHGIDWKFFGEAYRARLPHVHNNWDFAELLSELLGELNASHTGAGHRPRIADGDSTASLGVFFDPDHAAPGLRVLEVLERGPLAKAAAKVRPGAVIESIDAQSIPEGFNYHRLLNRKAGQPVLITLRDPGGEDSRDITVFPISSGAEAALLYDRWIETRRAEIDKLSGGRIGYVHVKSMNDGSFRESYSEIFGRNTGKEALVVDTRFNGGGWLHDDLVTLLTGKRYFSFVPRGNVIGFDPHEKWARPSIVLMSESNYSNAHMFPLVYKTLGIGDLVGMPVPGTGTAVWWETLQDPSLYFGIPQVGVRDNEGNYLENAELFPDHEVSNPPGSAARGEDRQLEKAVNLLMRKLR